MAQPQPVPQLVDIAWQMYQHQITTGATSTIEMPLNLATAIGQQGIGILVARYCALIAAPVTAFEDSARGTLQISPSRQFHGHDAISPGAAKPKAKAATKAKVARPPNAFILYRQHWHPLLKAEDPDAHNNSISVTLGHNWRNEDAATKARFITMAKQAKARHLLEHPGYQYQPRKPSEKKRRMSRRKAAASANLIPSQPTSTVKPFASSTSVSSNPDVTLTIPKLPKNLAGNAMLELGDQDLDDDSFKAMLNEYNKSLLSSNNHVHNVLAHTTTTPVIYDEPAEDAQNDANFCLAQQDLNPLSLNGSVDWDEIFASGGTFDDLVEIMSPRTKTDAFDQHHEQYQNVVLARMSSIFED